MYVGLDDHHVIAAMFGNPKVSIPVDTTGKGVPPGPATYPSLAEDYGAFASVLQHDEEGERFVARHLHVSAVVIVHERTNEQDFVEEVMARHPRGKRAARRRLRRPQSPESRGQRTARGRSSPWGPLPVG